VHERAAVGADESGSPLADGLAADLVAEPAVDEDLDVDQCAALRDDHDRNTEPVTDETDNKQDLTRQLPE